MPRFSIIIPAHNEENYLRKTLYSLQNQTYQDFETIIVANGCSDKTEEIAGKRADEKTRLVSLSEANVSTARNAGAFKAGGEILLFLDADTQLENDSLQKINREFGEKYSVATTKVLPDEKKLKYQLAMNLKNLYHTTGIYHGCSGALICRRQDFHQVNGYDARFTVKEHRKLIIKLNKIGKFKCINTNVITSMRRFNRWGLAKATLFWGKQLFKAWFGDLSKSKYEEIR